MKWKWSKTKNKQKIALIISIKLMTVCKKFFERTFLGNIEKKMNQKPQNQKEMKHFSFIIIVSVIQHNLDFMFSSVYAVVKKYLNVEL